MSSDEARRGGRQGLALQARVRGLVLFLIFAADFRPLKRLPSAPEQHGLTSGKSAGNIVGAALSGDFAGNAKQVVPDALRASDEGIRNRGLVVQVRQMVPSTQNEVHRMSDRIAAVSDRPELASIVAQWRMDAFFDYAGGYTVEEMTALILAPPTG